MDAEGLRIGDTCTIRASIALVVQWCLRRGITGTEAEDVASETVQRAYERVESFRGDSKFETWLIGIARNVNNEKVRHRGRHAPSADDMDNGHELADADANVEQLVLDRMAVEEALSGLTEEQRETVVLRACGMTCREVAAELGCSPGAVRTRQFRAAAKIGSYARRWYGLESEEGQ